MRWWLWLVLSGCASAPSAKTPPGPADTAVFIAPAPAEQGVDEEPVAPAASEPSFVIDSASEDAPFPLYHPPYGWVRPSPSAPPPGSVVHEAFRRAARRCYENVLKTDAAIRGRFELVIRFRDQRPVEVRVIAPPELATLGACLQRAAAHLQIGTRDETTLTLPINLGP